MLEEDIAVFVRTAHCRMLGVESTLTERLNSVHIYHILEVFVIPYIDFLYLVRGTETVEEVDERNSALNSCKVSYRSQVHNLLRICLGEHCKAGLAASINVRVVTEDVKCMRSNAASRYVEYARKKLTGNLIHIRDHKKKSL